MSATDDGVIWGGDWRDAGTILHRAGGGEKPPDPKLVGRAHGQAQLLAGSIIKPAVTVTLDVFEDRSHAIGAGLDDFHLLV
jgi:hypothetical protein